ncbi:flagellar hook-associated protein FlgL [Frigoribacterium sp. 2-23]|uniref:flagellar hook-associated protein FlgL n=1 Tax=Frigoribacterium sp. 2-23 TaxID=3415006 RepID=UPI003C704A1D
MTNQMTMQSAQRNLQTSASRMNELQERATTLDKIGKPSDDPTGTAESLRVRGQQAATAQFTRNADDGNSWLSVADEALSSAHDILAKARDLTVQGANTGALSPDAREAIAVQLDGLRTDLLNTANRSFNGRSVFAGTSDAGAAFAPDYSFTGVAGSSVTRRVGADTVVRVDADGAAAFGDGASSAFALLDGIAADLRAGVNVGSRLAGLDERLAAVRGTQGVVGANQTQILRAKDTLMDTTTFLETQRSGIEDLDLGQAILDLKMQQTAYQAALGVTASVLQPTLMDFLR